MKLRGLSLGRLGCVVPHGGPWALWGICALLILGHAGEAQAKGTPAGTRIESWAEATYVGPNGIPYTVVSDTLVFTVAQVAGVDLEPPRASVGDPGVTIVFDHWLTNVGNGDDTITVSADSRAGWPLRMYLDANENGSLDAGDTEITAPLPMAADDTVRLLVAVDVPGSASVRGSVDTVEVRATSAFDGSVTDTIQNTLEVRDVGIAVSLTKSVDRASATIGDILTYTINYTASGPNTATNLRITDPIPARTSFVPGTLSLNGNPLTDPADGDAGRFDAAANRVVFELGDVTGGDSGAVSFQVRVDG